LQQGFPKQKWLAATCRRVFPKKNGLLQTAGLLFQTGKVCCNLQETFSKKKIGETVNGVAIIEKKSKYFVASKFLLWKVGQYNCVCKHYLSV
jgi:hypothetical protein